MLEKAHSSASGRNQEGERKRTTDDVSKTRDDIKTEGVSLPREKPGGNLPTAQVVSGMKVARA